MFIMPEVIQFHTNKRVYVNTKYASKDFAIPETLLMTSEGANILQQLHILPSYLGHPSGGGGGGFCSLFWDVSN